MLAVHPDKHRSNPSLSVRTMYRDYHSMMLWLDEAVGGNPTKARELFEYASKKLSCAGSGRDAPEPKPGGAKVGGNLTMLSSVVGGYRAFAGGGVVGGAFASTKTTISVRFCHSPRRENALGHSPTLIKTKGLRASGRQFSPPGPCGDSARPHGFPLLAGFEVRQDDARGTVGLPWAR